MSQELLEAAETFDSLDLGEIPQVMQLPLEQWPLLADAFLVMGSPLPDPSRSSIMVAVKGGRILSFVVLQTALHAEPHFVYPEGQHQDLSELLYDAVHVLAQEAFSSNYFVIISDPALARKAQSNGFVEVPGTLYVRGT